MKKPFLILQYWRLRLINHFYSQSGDFILFALFCLGFVSIGLATTFGDLPSTLYKRKMIGFLGLGICFMTQKALVLFSEDQLFLTRHLEKWQMTLTRCLQAAGIGLGIAVFISLPGILGDYFSLVDILLLVVVSVLSSLIAALPVASATTLAPKNLSFSKRSFPYKATYFSIPQLYRAEILRENPIGFLCLSLVSAGCMLGILLMPLNHFQDWAPSLFYIPLGFSLFLILESFEMSDKSLGQYSRNWLLQAWFWQFMFWNIFAGGLILLGFLIHWSYGMGINISLPLLLYPLLSAYLIVIKLIYRGRPMGKTIALGLSLVFPPSISYFLFLFYGEVRNS